jgi:hypothetical protein
MQDLVERHLVAGVEVLARWQRRIANQFLRGNQLP